MATNNKISRILITGGCGFIGANLIKYLFSANNEIVSIDNLSSGTIANLEATGVRLNNIELIEGDIRDCKAVRHALNKVDAVVHLAAETSVIDSLVTPVEHWETNVTGTLNLLEESRRSNIKGFILASSNAVLGEQAPPANENQPPKPLSPYGATKMACEALCSAYTHSYGLTTYSLRFSNCYGPFSIHKPSVISLFIQRLLDNKPLTIYGDGNQTRDFVHVNDICQAISLCLADAALPSQKNNGGETFQIASGTETAINELVSLLGAISTKELAVAYEPARKGEIVRNFSDITKARSLLRFNPQTDLKTGLTSLWEWYNDR